MSEVKPCPFCGSTDVAANSYSIEASVRCFDCFAVIVRKHPKYSDGGLVAAITAWNARATDALIREAMETLRFYADEGYDGYNICITDYGLSTENGPIITDSGKQARATLAKLRAHMGETE